MVYKQYHCSRSWCPRQCHRLVRRLE